MLEQRRSIDPVWSAEPVLPLEEAPATSSQYGDWARRQRPQGTVYGGSPPAHDPAGRTPQETTGSLAGHILAQGRSDEADGGSGSKAVMIILIVMIILVVGGLGLGIAYLSGVFH